METLNFALCLHASDSDLTFLNSVRRNLDRSLGPVFKSYELESERSHVDALRALREMADGLVILFAHGSGDYVLGGSYRCRMTRNIIDFGKFITGENLTDFSGKVVFCMSCNSNDLAQPSIDAGAIAFVGFDKIPFRRFDTKGNDITTHFLREHCQEKLIAPAIAAALDRFLTRGATLDEAVDYLRLWVAKNAVAYVRKYSERKDSREVAALFLKMKDGLRYHGPLGIRFATKA
jgi:hypothetical protein